MRALHGEYLLAACERAQGEGPLLRAITLLAATVPDYGRAELVQLPLIDRNRLLLQLRAVSFGPVLEGYAHCAHCDAAMEFALPVESVLRGLADARPSVEWREGTMQCSLRQATTGDLLASMDTSDPETTLLRRCIDPDVVIEDDALPELLARFEQLHADGELRCMLCCPQCSRQQPWDLDIAHFVWIEARNAARQLLADIHTLALHYGWSETAIATMSRSRRAAYLEMLGI